MLRKISPAIVEPGWGRKSRANLSPLWKIPNYSRRYWLGAGQGASPLVDAGDSPGVGGALPFGQILRGAASRRGAGGTLEERLQRPLRRWWRRRRICRRTQWAIRLGELGTLRLGGASPCAGGLRSRRH